MAGSVRKTISPFARKSIEDLQAEAGSHGLHRALGPMHLVLFGIGCILGAGIYVLPGTAAANFAGPAVMISFVLAGTACALTALCYAELASTMPVSGSSYSYCYASLGEVFAWGLGWILMLEYTLASSTLAVGFSSYLTSLLRNFAIVLPPYLSTPLVGSTGSFSLNLVAVLAIAAVTTVLCAGVRQSAGVNAFLVVVKVAVIVIVIAVGAGAIDPANWSPFIPEHEGEFAFGWPGILRAASILFFAYLGFETVSTAASESRNPQRDLPIGILGALVVCTVLYLAVAAVLTGVVPYRELGVADPVALAVDRMGRPGVAVFVKVGALMGLASVLLVNAYGQSRITFQMSRDGMLPAIFSRVHERFRTPQRGIIVLGPGFCRLRRVLSDPDARGPGEPRRRARVRDGVLLHDVAAHEAARPSTAVSRAARWLPGRTRMDRLHSGHRTRALPRHDHAGAHRRRFPGGFRQAADGSFPRRLCRRRRCALHGLRPEEFHARAPWRIAVTERSDIFAPASDEQVLRLVLSHPLAWVVSPDAVSFRAAPLPLRPRVGGSGRIEALEGHMARSNPLYAAVQSDSRALVLFSGPQGYISPSWVSNRTWAPTWNYAVVQFVVTMAFDEDPVRLDTHLNDLVTAMEHGRPGAWQPSEMGARYETLKRMIVPFEATVVEQRAKFKLGQDERESVFAEITDALGRSGSDDLLAWMRELNPDR